MAHHKKTQKYLGQHLFVIKKGYTHHGLGIGDDKVIHYSGFAEAFTKGPICIASFDEFSGGALIRIKKHPNRKHNVSESIQRAHLRLGEDGYSLWGNNCEHFVEWCVEGDHHSRQVDIGTTALGAILIPKFFGSATKKAIRSSGAVKNTSGPGIMSGLSAIGNSAIKGSGARGGVIIIAGTSGIGSSYMINHTVLKDSDLLPEIERSARKNGRMASRVGAAATTIGSLYFISTCGSVAGLSGAGFTSGLAAIGGTVGGGMLTGTAIIAAAPAALTALAGYGTYKVYKWLTRKR